MEKARCRSLKATCAMRLFRHGSEAMQKCLVCILYWHESLYAREKVFASRAPSFVRFDGVATSILTRADILHACHCLCACQDMQRAMGECPNRARADLRAEQWSPF